MGNKNEQQCDDKEEEEERDMRNEGEVQHF